ncbi:MAG: hypothetical protein KF729_36820 [Sandaracinaceae bacterium]|nr:hypothetical protein [Sandaracinaceae bacterium]
MPRHRPFIVHIDDDAATRRAVANVLGLLDALPVRGAASVRDAEALLREPGVLPCGFVVDHTLPLDETARPEPRGLAFAVTLRQRYPRAPVVLLTGALDRRLAAECAAAEIVYLPKPVDLEDALDPLVRRAAELAACVRWSDLDHFADATGATDRELEVIRASAQDLSRGATARALGIRPETVKTHRRNAITKGGVATLQALVDAILQPIDPAPPSPSTPVPTPPRGLTRPSGRKRKGCS